MMDSNDKPQEELFYAFNLEDMVSEDHLLRHIDRFLDFSELREHLAPYYSHTGRPSFDPVPDHSTFSKLHARRRKT